MADAATPGWTNAQRHTVVASLLAWTLDSFDFFVITFVLRDIAKDFGAQIIDVSLAIFLTLAMRPVGAYLFGRLADRFGRKPILILDLVLFTILEVASGFAPNLMIFLVLRALFGIAMGGEWGIGASLTLETIPPKARGAISGILQCGWPGGQLAAAVVYLTLFTIVGWRGMFFIGAVPGVLLVFYFWFLIPESPRWKEHKGATLSTFAALKGHWRIAVYALLVMSAFSFFSHGTQDLYPTLLQVQRHFDITAVAWTVIVFNSGAIAGSIFFGTISQWVGRRAAIVAAAVLALPIIPFWLYSDSLLYLVAGGFLIQFMVQGAYGVIPAHLNELAPPGTRGTFPGFVFQLGNFVASPNATLQIWIAMQFGGDYRIAIAGVAAAAAIIIAVLVGFGVERHGVELHTVEKTAA